MTLDQFANIAKIIGVVIVVVTLIYLSVQLRQNTQALHSTGAQATHDALGTYYLALARNGELLALFRAGTMRAVNRCPGFDLNITSGRLVAV